MNVIKLQRQVNTPAPAPSLTCHRKYPQFQQGDIFALQDAFRKLDVDDKGYLDENTAIKNVQSSEHQPYDVVRQALKEVELDSSRRVELEDYVDVHDLLAGDPANARS
jgi:plastin-1